MLLKTINKCVKHKYKFVKQYTNVYFFQQTQKVCKRCQQGSLRVCCKKYTKGITVTFCCEYLYTVSVIVIIVICVVIIIILMNYNWLNLENYWFYLILICLNVWFELFIFSLLKWTHNTQTQGHWTFSNMSRDLSRMFGGVQVTQWKSCFCCIQKKKKNYLH